MSRVYWEKVPTTSEVYCAILNANKDDLIVFESFSNPDGGWYGGGRGEMYTVWGLKGAACAMLGARSTWDVVRVDPALSAYVRGNPQHEYWLCKPVME